MSEHTKEPWGVVSEKWYLNGQPSIVGRNGAGFAVALMAPWGPAVNDSVDKREANARRIVACVNACAGIPTEAIEAGVVDALRKAVVNLLNCHTGAPWQTEDTRNRAFRAVNAVMALFHAE